MKVESADRVRSRAGSFFSGIAARSTQLLSPARSRDQKLRQEVKGRECIVKLPLSKHSACFQVTNTPFYSIRPPICSILPADLFLSRYASRSYTRSLCEKHLQVILKNGQLVSAAIASGTRGDSIDALSRCVPMARNRHKLYEYLRIFCEPTRRTKIAIMSRVTAKFVVILGEWHMLPEYFLRTINYLETKNSSRRCAVTPRWFSMNTLRECTHLRFRFFVVGDDVFLSIVKIGLAVQYFCSF